LLTPHLKESRHVIPQRSPPSCPSLPTGEGLSRLPRGRRPGEVAPPVRVHLHRPSPEGRRRRQLQDVVPELLERQLAFVRRRVPRAGREPAHPLHRQVRRSQSARRARGHREPRAGGVRHRPVRRSDGNPGSDPARDVLPRLAGIADAAGDAGRARDPGLAGAVAMFGVCMRPFPLLLLAAALLAACGTQVVNPVTGKTERTVMDEQTEIAEGAKAHKEVLQEYRGYDNPRLQAYVDDLGQRLAKQSHRAGLTWTFTVLDSPEINAFALPGGYVYVTRGIMAFLDSEAELAGVMGHEIGHVTVRHGAQRATRRQSAGIGVIAATVLGAVLEIGGVSGATTIASQLSQSAAAGYVASYSRDQESQADELGAEYLARNHYDPRNMIDVIQALKSQEQFAIDTAKAEGKPAPSGSNWLSSHPANDKRLADMK